MTATLPTLTVMWVPPPTSSGINVERLLTPEEARAQLRVSKGVFAQWVDLGRLRVIRTSPKRYMVSQQAVRDLIHGGGR